MRDRSKGTSSFTLKPSHRIFQLTSDPNFAYFNTIMYTLMDLCKNEKLDILRKLLVIEEAFFQSKLLLRDAVSTDDQRTDDQERYLKMAMRLDSNDPTILQRKKKEIICK